MPSQTTVGDHIEDVYEYFARLRSPDAPVHSDYVQLSRGRLGLEIRATELPGLRFRWGRTEALVLHRCEVRATTDPVSWGFVLPIEDGPPIKLNGQELGSTEAGMFPVGESDYLFSPGTGTLEINVDAELASMLGWAHGVSPLETSPIRLLRIRRACLGAARETGTDVGSLKRRRDQILGALDDAFGHQLVATAARDRAERSRSFEIARAAEDAFEQMRGDTLPDMDAVASELGVSSRYVSGAYRAWIGVSPYQYLHRVRLNRLRRSLLGARGNGGSVSQLAMAEGFTHLGRLARSYHDHFGELPSETLHPKRYARR